MRPQETFLWLDRYLGSVKQVLRMSISNKPGSSSGAVPRPKKNMDRDPDPKDEYVEMNNS